MGEARRKALSARREAGEVPPLQVVDTPGGRLHVRWDQGAAATPHGQLVFFAEFLAATGTFERWVSQCLCAAEWIENIPTPTVCATEQTPRRRAPTVALQRTNDRSSSIKSRCCTCMEVKHMKRLGNDTRDTDGQRVGVAGNRQQGAAPGPMEAGTLS